MMSDIYFQALETQAKLESLLKGLKEDFNVTLVNINETVNSITTENMNGVNLLVDFTKRLDSLKGRIAGVDYLYNQLCSIMEQFAIDRFKEEDKRTAEREYLSFVSGSVFQNTIDSLSNTLK